ncbi:MAG: hypothetical protein GXO03_00945 [Aquificae bacterium]|nr:hypothetical protein [Aquificota bacterium]
MKRVKVVKFYPYEVPLKRGAVLAYFDVLLYDSVLVKGVKLMKNAYGGLFVSMPSLQTEKGSVQVVEITDRELLEEIRRTLVDYYREKTQ